MIRGIIATLCKDCRNEAEFPVVVCYSKPIYQVTPETAVLGQALNKRRF